MPWSPGDAKSHDKAANTPTKQKQWSEIADSVLQRTGNEGLAIKEANGIIKRQEGRIH